MSKFVDDVKERFLDKAESRFWEILAIVLMLIPVVISLQVFKREYLVTEGMFIWKTTRTQTDNLSIAPTMVSVLYAIILHGILYARGIGRYFESGYSLILNFLNILWTASFISIFISSETFNIPIVNQPMSSQVLMLIAIALSLISMRSIAGVFWIALAFLSIFRLSALNDAMSFWGVIYILFAYGSIGIQIWKLKLLAIDKSELIYEFRGMSNRVLGDINSSVIQAKDTAKNIQSQIGGLKEKYINKSIESKE